MGQVEIDDRRGRVQLQGQFRLRQGLFQTAGQPQQQGIPVAGGGIVRVQGGGEEEARLAMLGCMPLIDQPARDLMMLDIGGGSTEILVIDRSRQLPVFMASSEGGMEIEKVAAETPEKIIKEWIHPSVGLQSYQLRKLAFALGLKGEQVKNGIKILNALWNVFVDNDCSLIEINPLVVTKDDRVIALDAKVNFDENGLFRHKELLKLRDITEEDPSELEASKYNLNYIKLTLSNTGNSELTITSHNISISISPSLSVSSI